MGQHMILLLFVGLYICNFFYLSSARSQTMWEERLEGVKVFPCNHSESCLLVDQVKSMNLSLDEFLSKNIVAFIVENQKSMCSKMVEGLITPRMVEKLRKFNITFAKRSNPKYGPSQPDEVYTIIDKEMNNDEITSCDLMNGRLFETLLNSASNLFFRGVHQTDILETVKSIREKPLVRFRVNELFDNRPMIIPLLSDMRHVLEVTWEEVPEVRKSKKLLIDVYQPWKCQLPVKNVDSLKSCRSAHLEVTISDTVQSTLCKVYAAALQDLKAENKYSIDLRRRKDDSWLPIVRKLSLHCGTVVILAYEKIVNANVELDVLDLRLIEDKKPLVVLKLTQKQVNLLNEEFGMKQSASFYVHSRQEGHMAYAGSDSLEEKLAFIDLKLMIANGAPITMLRSTVPSVDSEDLVESIKRSNRENTRWKYLEKVKPKAYHTLKKAPFVLYVYSVNWNVRASAVSLLVEDTLKYLKEKKVIKPRLVMVDCFALAKECLEDGITSYPQIVLYRDGEATPFTGTVSKQTLTNLALLGQYPRIIEIETEAKWRQMTEFFLDDLTNYVIGVNLEKSKDAMEAFKSLSKKIHTNQAFVLLKTDKYLPDIIRTRLQKDEKITGSYLMSLSFTEYPQLIVSEGSLTKENIERFIETAQYDRMIHVTWARFVEVSQLSRPLLLVFFKTTDRDRFRVMEKINLLFKGKITTALPDMNDDRFIRVFNTYGLNQAIGYALYGFEEKTVHIFHGDTTKLEEVEEWLQKALAKKIPASITLPKMSFANQFPTFDFTEPVYSLSAKLREEEEDKERMKAVEMEEDMNEIRGHRDEL